MKLGTMQSVMKGKDDAEVFTRAKSLGLAGVEPDLRGEELTDRARARLRELQRVKGQTGVAAPSVCLGYLNGRGFVADPARTGEVVAEIEAAIDWAEVLGAEVILLPFFGPNDPKDRPAEIERTAKVLKPLCVRARDRGVTLCFEGTLSADQMHVMAQEIDASDGFGVYFDLANVVWVGLNGSEQIRRLGALIRQVHMKETKVGPGDVRPGEGRVDYAASAEALRAIGYDGWLVLETPAGPVEQVAEDIVFTKRYFPV